MKCGANKIVENLKQNTKQVEKMMSDNAEKITTQNNVITETVKDIADTIHQLKQSAEAVQQVDTISPHQNIALNESVENLNSEAQQFNYIASSVQQSKQALEEIASNVNRLNEFVNDIHKLLL